MNKYKILIVEDELLIAHHIKQFLEKANFECVGIAINYEEAIVLLKKEDIDIVLLDVTLSGSKTGIDVAREINNSFNVPFIYLTSYSDAQTLKTLKETYPLGYLSKPINEINVITTLEIACNNIAFKDKKPFLFEVNNEKHTIDLNDLICIKDSNNHVMFIFNENGLFLETSFDYILDLLPEHIIKQVNDTVAVNPLYVSKIEKNKLFVRGNEYEILDQFKYNFT